MDSLVHKAKSLKGRLQWLLDHRQFLVDCSPQLAESIVPAAVIDKFLDTRLSETQYPFESTVLFDVNSSAIAYRLDQIVCLLSNSDLITADVITLANAVHNAVTANPYSPSDLYIDAAYWRDCCSRVESFANYQSRLVELVEGNPSL